MYGGFWMSFATVFLPGSGITAAYTSEEELSSALGIYLFTWMIITFLLLCVLPTLYQRDSLINSLSSASDLCAGTWASLFCSSS